MTQPVDPTALHSTLDTTCCTLSGCRSHFTLTNTGLVHFSSPTAHITTQVQEHYLTWHLASKLCTNHPGWPGGIGRDSDLPRIGVCTPLTHVLLLILGFWLTRYSKCTPPAHRLMWILTIVT